MSNQADMSSPFTSSCEGALHVKPLHMCSSTATCATRCILIRCCLNPSFWFGVRYMRSLTSSLALGTLGMSQSCPWRTERKKARWGSWRFLARGPRSVFSVRGKVLRRVLRDAARSDCCGLETWSPRAVKLKKVLDNEGETADDPRSRD